MVYGILRFPFVRNILYFNFDIRYIRRPSTQVRFLTAHAVGELVVGVHQSFISTFKFAPWLYSYMFRERNFTLVSRNSFVGAMAGEPRAKIEQETRPNRLQASGDSDASSHWDCGSRIFNRSWHEEARLQLLYSVPLVLSMALQQLQVIVILAMLNSVTPQRENATVLGGVGIAVMIINATGYYWIVGLSGGIETLCSQLFGLGQHSSIGLVLQTALVVIGALSAPVAIIWWYLGDLLEAIGVDPGQSQVAGRFAR